METIGYIALGLFGCVGFLITLYAIIEFFTIQFSMFKLKVGTELDVKKEHLAGKTALRKVRLERKRQANDLIATKFLEYRIAKKNQKTDVKLGLAPKTENKEEATQQVVVEKTEEPKEE
ncbi:MAG: hypothetical protein FWD32_00465 [Firmicutes bacterium]|nr:hypothetical protein [Bacillota bacterium]